MLAAGHADLKHDRAFFYVLFMVDCALLGSQKRQHLKISQAGALPRRNRVHDHEINSEQKTALAPTALRRVISNNPNEPISIVLILMKSLFCILILALLAVVLTGCGASKSKIDTAKVERSFQTAEPALKTLAAFILIHYLFLST